MRTLPRAAGRCTVDEEPSTPPKARLPESSCSCPPAAAARDKGSAPTSIEQEVSTALDNLGAALARADSAVGKILKITLMLSDVDDYPEMQNALLAFYREHAPHMVETPPASTFMEVAAIVPGGARFQIDVVAVE